MDFKLTWVGNIYQKIETVCQEVDDIIREVQNVGHSVKQLYSDVVQELLPSLVNYAKEGSTTDENHVSMFFKSTKSNAIDPANNQQAHDVVVDDDSRETYDLLKENFHVSIEHNALKSKPQLLNLLLFSESSPSFYDIGFGALAGEVENSYLSVKQDLCAIVEENAINSSTPEVLNFMSLGEKEPFEASTVSESSDGVDDNECGVLAKVSPVTSIVNMKSQSSLIAGTVNDNLAASDQCVSDGSEASGTLSAKSPASYSFEIESCKNNSAGVAGCSIDSSMALVSCAMTPDVAGQIMASQARLISYGSSQSMEFSDGETLELNEVMSLNSSSEIRHGQMCSTQNRSIISLSDIDESLVNSIESSVEDIPLGDDAKLEGSCVYVNDNELYPLSCRVQRLRPYKKRIQDLFALKKRLEKEYEQLAIWYGDTGMASSQGASRTLLPFKSRTSLESKNLQVQQAYEIEWELL